MRVTHLVAALALSSLPLVVHGSPAAPPASAAPAGKGGTGASCMGDAECGGKLVCDASCPVIPGRIHCDIAGGVCEPRCTQTGSSLNGKSFASLDGVHSIQFESPSTYRKTDGCAKTGTVQCHHIVVSTGTYRASGATISLTSSQGAHDTLKVEPHCYDGLLDTSDHIELYPPA